jgi:transcriptional regulator with XRE-family HTH domain
VRLGCVIADRPREQAKQQAKRSSAAIGEFIREQREQAEVSVRQLARLAGVSNPYLSQIERGLRKPSADILQQIAKGLRISAEQLYVRAGILESRKGNPELIAAILAD